MKYRILSFDGGGLRGMVTLRLLQRLQVAVPNLIANTDLLAGTSTGGIIALGLAMGKSPAEMYAFYRDNGKRIFDASWLHNLTDLDGLSGADYDNTGLKKGLITVFGTATLGSMTKRVVIPSFELDNGAVDPAERTWKPVFFHNFPGSDSDAAETAVDVAMDTSAAPTYFPTHGSYIDGGVAANNPSMAALAQTQDLRAEIDPRPALEDILLLSIGTGTVRNYISGKDLDWGLAQWAKPLVNLLLDANIGIADYQCSQLLRRNYLRLAPAFPPGVNIKMDDCSRMQDLFDFAESVKLDSVVEWLSSAGW